MVGAGQTCLYDWFDVVGGNIDGNLRTGSYALDTEIERLSAWLEAKNTVSFMQFGKESE